MQHALGFRSFSAALHFFKEWPDQAHAAQLVLTRAPEIDGNLYFLLDPAAQLIEGKHPLAATLLRRAMIEDTLEGAKSTRYKHAARHLLECASIAPSIQDFGVFETHESFVARLRARHSRKTGFWTQMAERVWEAAAGANPFQIVLHGHFAQLRGHWALMQQIHRGTRHPRPRACPHLAAATRSHQPFRAVPLRPGPDAPGLTRVFRPMWPCPLSGLAIRMTSVLCSSPSAPMLTSLTIQATLPLPQREYRPENTSSGLAPPISRQSPRRLASYTAQLVTRCRCFGMRCRWSQLTLNGMAGALLRSRARPHPAYPRRSIQATRATTWNTHRRKQALVIH